MALPNESAEVSALKAMLVSEHLATYGAEYDSTIGDKALETIARAVIKYLRQRDAQITVVVPGTGLIAPPNGGPVTGSASGTIT